MSLTKVLHVVRRRLWLQTVLRHYIALVLEVLSVFALSRVIIPPDVPDVDMQRLTMRPEPIIYDSFEANKQPLFIEAVVYRPRNPETDALIMKSFGHGHSPEVTALMKGPEVESKCRAEWAKYGTRGRVACVQFADLFGVTVGGSLEYDLLQATKYEVPERLPLTGPKSFSLGAKDGLMEYFNYILVEQAKIDYHFLQKAKGSSQVPKVLLRQLPDAPPFREQRNFRATILIITVMVFSIPFLRRVSAITLELETGMKDQQRINGLPVWAFWLGHFVSAFAIQMFESIIIIAIMYFVGREIAMGAGRETLRGGSFYRHTDVSLVLFVMTVFNTGHVLLAMLVAATLKKGNRAMFGAIFVGFFIPLIIVPNESTSLSHFVFQDRWTKLKCAICPQLGCTILLRTLAAFDDYEATSYRGPQPIRSPRFSALRSSDMQPGYWMPPKVIPVAEVDVENRDPERFSTLPDLAPAVEIRALTVRFGTFTALDRVSFKIYSTQVTALLGHNGAGKTTLMSTITGLLKPTLGAVEFPGGESDSRGNCVGFCQQFDVLFPDLTVMEHLLYFGQLQGWSGDELKKSIDHTLEAVKLADKANSFPSQLSGGMKRRLSMSIALVTKPKLLILDEPTTGMDPETRRSIWDLLSEVRNDTTILLSTHDMEEAEVLADRIVMLSSGKLVCAGTPAFLKQSCGVGYTINVNTESPDFDLKETLDIVRETAPNAILQDVKQGTTTLALQTTEHKGFAKMFQKLEEEGERLGITSFGVSVATMTDAYIK
ncbi:hypothetical protein HPB50_003748 [Hyalomma asiaticum]|uniref:Uncharacterized protein n=1 Tax=Hyalomma asiaticum TaxID=266040 RepID=A0ACB7SS19_HYAAI|nr:hypothetical protein HPB50_003748 [Hyalomma asiaticum]